MIGCIVHIDAAGLGGRLAEICSGAVYLASRLQHQGVVPAVLLQCSSASDVAALHAEAPAAGAAPVPLSIAQPSQFPVSLRLALSQLAPAQPSNIVFVSISDSGDCARQAAALGCTTEQLPARTATPAQLQAWALQAVACHAAAQQVPPALRVGYVMKESRQLALCQQGMLPLLPTTPPLVSSSSAAGTELGAAPAAAANGGAGEKSGSSTAPQGMCFFPLDLGSSLPRQLCRCQLVLQKFTDCLQPGMGSGSGAVASLAPEAAALVALLEPAQQPPAQQQQQQHEQRLTDLGVQQQAAGAAAAAAAGRPAGGAAAAPGSAAAVCLVDPAPALRPIMDRAVLAKLLAGVAADVRQQAGIPMRAPASLLLHVMDVGATPRQLAAAGVALPCIVKPQAACGVTEAHQMAIVLHGSGFADLEVPLPAVAQEYVDHSGILWKVYVAGQQVFWTQRKSTPDLGPLARRLAEDPEAAAERDIPSSIAFDSLKGLPTNMPWVQRAQAGAQAQGPMQQQQEGGGMAPDGAPPLEATPRPLAAGGGGGGGDPPPAAPSVPPPPSPPLPPGQELMRRSTFEAVAGVLRRRLGLTLFGFDIVVDAASEELVIVDVNYFPSFKGIPEAPAAVQAALREHYQAFLAQ